MLIQCLNTILNLNTSNTTLTHRTKTQYHNTVQTHKTKTHHEHTRLKHNTQTQYEHTLLKHNQKHTHITNHNTNKHKTTYSNTQY